MKIKFIAQIVKWVSASPSIHIDLICAVALSAAEHFCPIFILPFCFGK